MANESTINSILRKADFDVDKHLNTYIPAPAPHKLPKLVRRFLGYHDKPPSPIPDIVRSLWVLIASFTGIIVVMATFKYSSVFIARDTPIFIPSWAATAILVYNVIESPLGQPRNTFFGTIVSSFIGICITKLFMLNPNNEQYLWVSGALCVAVASIAMGVTKTIHPPGGAAALLCSIDTQVRNLGWFYLVVQIVSGLLILAVACLFNNVQRRYPLYWWTPNTLKATPVKSDEDSVSSFNKNAEPVRSPLATLQRVLSERHVIGPEETGDVSVQDLKQFPSGRLKNAVLILPTHFSLPQGLELTEEEEALLVNIQDQLKDAAIRKQEESQAENIV